jgi:hypothetical protein
MIRSGIASSPLKNGSQLAAREPTRVFEELARRHGVEIRG